MDRPWWRTLATAAAVATLLSALAVVTSQPTDKMAKYYKRTGQKFLDEKSKVVHVGSARLAPPGAREDPFARTVASHGPACGVQEEGVHKLPSGMLYRVLKEGKVKGKKTSPNIGDSCEVTYAGKLKDGTPFDSGTTSFAPNQVIKGWTEALQLMCEGDKLELFIPYDMAYGERGSPPKIPPYNPLVFEVELHKVKEGGKPCKEAKEQLKAKLKEAAEKAEL